MLTGLKWRCNHIIPLVMEDGTMTQYEVLCKLTYKLNEVINEINKDDSDLVTYVDEKVKALDIELTQKINNSSLESKAYTDSEFKRLEMYVNSQLAFVYEFINASNMWNKTYILVEIEKLRQEISKITSVMVVSPVDNRLKPIQNVLDEMYDVLRYFSLTTSEYDSLHLNALEYDSKNITAFSYDMNGKYILWAYMPMWKMFSPFSGQYVQTKQVVYELASLHALGNTASQYDSLEFTAESYDELNKSAYSYDWTVTN